MNIKTSIIFGVYFGVFIIGFSSLPIQEESNENNGNITQNNSKYKELEEIFNGIKINENKTVENQELLKKMNDIIDTLNGTQFDLIFKKLFSDFQNQLTNLNSTNSKDLNKMMEKIKMGLKYGDEMNKILSDLNQVKLNNLPIEISINIFHKIFMLVKNNSNLEEMFEESENQFEQIKLKLEKLAENLKFIEKNVERIDGMYNEINKFIKREIWTPIMNGIIDLLEAKDAQKQLEDLEKKAENIKNSISNSAPCHAAKFWISFIVGLSVLAPYLN